MQTLPPSLEIQPPPPRPPARQGPPPPAHTHEDEHQLTSAPCRYPLIPFFAATHTPTQNNNKARPLRPPLPLGAGDLRPDAPLRDLGLGAFTRELDEAVCRCVADVAVHSLKDSPATAAPGLVLAACLAREDVRDVLIALEARSLGG